jgi:ketosteroid isomerase-like protein
MRGGESDRGSKGYEARHEMTSRALLFDDIDRMDAAAFASYLAPDSVARFGNRDPVYGRDACREALAELYERFDAVHHDVIEQWEHGEATIVEGNVTYTLKDGGEITLPLVTIYRTNAKNQIADYRVYVDASPALARS